MISLAVSAISASGVYIVILALFAPGLLVDASRQARRALAGTPLGVQGPSTTEARSSHRGRSD